MSRSSFYAVVGLALGSVLGLTFIVLGELTSTPTVCPLPEINQANVLSLE